MTTVPSGLESDASAPSRKRLARNALRVAVGLLFVAAGVSKLVAPTATSVIVASRNLPEPTVIGAAVGIVEAVSGALLVAGLRVRWVAAALSVLVAVAAGLFHTPVVLAGPRALEIGVDAGVLLALYLIATRAGSADPA